MRAVRIVKYGGLDDLAVEEIPVGDPAPGEVLVEVRAAAVNPVDIANLAGKVRSANGTAAIEPPRTAGRDYAGVVVAGPPGLIGQEVWGTSGELAVGRPGAQAEFLAVPVDSVSTKPAGLSFAEAAAVGVSYTAAWLSLSERADVQAGEIVLVTGAAGVVGRAATQIAHWRGAQVIGADLNVADDLAADIVIDTSKQDLASAVRDATSGAGADAAINTVGGPLFGQVLDALRHGGRSTVIASAGGPVAQLNLLEFYRNERSVYGVNTLDLPLARAARILDILRRGFESGALRAPRTRAFPLEEAATAYKAVLSGTGGAKVVLEP